MHGVTMKIALSAVNATSCLIILRNPSKTAKHKQHVLGHYVWKRKFAATTHSTRMNFHSTDVSYSINLHAKLYRFGELGKFGSLIQCLIVLCHGQPVSCNFRPGVALNSFEFKANNEKNCYDLITWLSFVVYGKIRYFRNISEAVGLVIIQIKFFIYKSNLCEVSDCLPP